MLDIPSLFLMALVLWGVSCMLDAEETPRFLRGLIFARAALLLVIAAKFALLESEMPFVPMTSIGADGERHGLGGTAAFLVPLFNFFPLLGRTGNAIFWGASGLWILRSAWGDGWYWANVAMWEETKARAAAEALKRDKKKARRTARRARLKRAGVAVMRVIKDIIRRL